MNPKNKPDNRIRFSGLSPWVILGAVAVLLSIVTLMATEDISRQKRQSIRLMTEKGAALIRSVEAGTRMGMRGGQGSGFQLQRLLEETAAQADIAHLVVVQPDGSVVAGSDREQIGSRYGMDLDLSTIHASDELFWRRQVSTDGTPVVEIFGKFSPMPARFMRSMRHHTHDRLTLPDAGDIAPAMVIFVGFRTDDLDAVRTASIRQTLVTAAVLLLVGCAGVLLLFRVQSDRATRTSLAQVQAFSDSLVSRIPIGLMAVDPDSRITLVNAVAASILRLVPAKIIGRSAEGHIPPILWEIVRPSGPATGPVEKEVVWDRGDGFRIPMDVTAVNLVDETGNSFGRVILLKDLTEIYVLRKELEKNRRLALVGQLAAGVAHEIRNPLSSIKGFAVYFKEKYAHDPSDQEVSDILIQEVDRLNRVVGQLLEFSHPIKPHFQNVSLASFFADSIKRIDPSCRSAGVQASLRLSDPHLHAKMDVDKMNQVMLNLYLNALDAMPDGGDLTVTVSEDADSGGIRIQVQDTGKGIAPEDQLHLFEPYFSTKKTGTGLGLAIVYNIISAHQGKIRVTCPAGGGSCVEIILPQVKEG
ncbi:hypothetical protein LJC71_10245 [Desulfosarcina sp. OttesenSCG-928-A07]|nr:hypothetical protein [Desulfosarcina sp. OttesenSCG-928-G17]MDL2330100.1 hypothetical protein [Desulfosarcina sp. OttesenSCG-928-A07]